MRAWLLAVLCCALAARACAQETDKQTEEQQQHQQQPQQQQQQQQPLTAIRLPSEFRRSRLVALGLSAARALAASAPSSLSLSSSTLHSLAVAGALVLGVLGVGAVLGLLGMFGFRPCYLLGTCDGYPGHGSGHAYLAPGALDAYAYSQPMYPPVTAYAKSYDGATNDLQYSYDPYQSMQVQGPYTNAPANAYQKRSLEYVGPILKILSNAYDKYNHPVSGAGSEQPSAADKAVEPKPH